MIKFKDLSVPLKILVVYAYITLAVYFLYFLAGFIAGVVSLIWQQEK